MLTICTLISHTQINFSCDAHSLPHIHRMRVQFSSTNAVKKYTYTLAAKRSIVMEAYAEPLSVKRIARKFHVQPNQIRRWKRQFEGSDEDLLGLIDDPTLPSSSWSKRRVTRTEGTRAAGAGRKCSFSEELIADLKKFFDTSRDEDFAVSLRLMIAEVRLLSPTTTSGLTNSVLEARIYRLLQKWNVTWRRGTHKAQNTRYSQVIIDDYHSYIRMKIKLLGVDCSAVYNADETNVYFSPQPTCTYAPRGSRTVSIKGANSSSRCSVMQGASMSGEKIPPFLIFKGKNTRSGHIKRELEKKDGLPEDMEYGVQEKAWMDEELMLEWIQKVWKPTTQHNTFSYLILDECRSHLTAKVRAAFAECNTEVDLIPGDYTSKLQPMDVGANKPFKGYVSDNFTDWLIVNRNKKPTRQDVSGWIRDGWMRLPKQIVLNSFRGAGYDVGSSLDSDDETSSLNEESSLLADDLWLLEPSDVDETEETYR